MILLQMVSWGLSNFSPPQSYLGPREYHRDLPRNCKRNYKLEKEREKQGPPCLWLYPEDHLAKFHKMTDAKEMWDAIKSRFEGLHKGLCDKFNVLLSQLELHGAVIFTEDANKQILRSLPSAWSQVSLIMRTKPGVDSLSFDDLYNNLRVFESDVKGSTASSSSRNGILLESVESREIKITGGGMHGILEPRMGAELERRRTLKHGKQIDGEGVDWSNHSEEDEDYALMACNSSESDTEEAQKKTKDLKAKVEKWHNSSKNLSKLLNTQMSANDKFGLGYGDHRYDGILSYENEVLQSVFMNKESELEKQPLYDSTEPLKLVSEPVVNESNVECEPKVWSDASFHLRSMNQIVTMIFIHLIMLDCDFHGRGWQENAELNLGVGTKVVIGDHRDTTGTISPNTMVDPVLEIDYPHRALKNKGIVDSGCSRHMTGPQAPLAEFHDLLMVALLAFGGKGPTWLFDLDYLTDSMNYHPVRSENQANIHAGQQEANHNAGTEDIIDAGEDESAQDCFVLPIWSSYSSTITPDLKTDEKREGPREEEQAFLDELERLKRQEKEANEEAEALRKEFAQETENLVIQEGAAKASSTNIFSTVSTPAKASSTNLVNTVSIPVSTASPHEGLSLSDPTNPDK
ncbi:hypothetical protein Tco_1386525 [Tanacetum coccineum]